MITRLIDFTVLASLRCAIRPIRLDNVMGLANTTVEQFSQTLAGDTPRFADDLNLLIGRHKGDGQASHQPQQAVDKRMDLGRSLYGPG